MSPRVHRYSNGVILDFALSCVLVAAIVIVLAVAL